MTCCPPGFVCVSCGHVNACIVDPGMYACPEHEHAFFPTVSAVLLMACVVACLTRSGKGVLQEEVEEEVAPTRPPDVAPEDVPPTEEDSPPPYVRVV